MGVIKLQMVMESVLVSEDVFSSGAVRVDFVEGADVGGGSCFLKLSVVSQEFPPVIPIQKNRTLNFTFVPNKQIYLTSYSNVS